MRRFPHAALILPLALAGIVAARAPAPAHGALPQAHPPSLSLSRLPVAFEPNVGQSDSRVAFIARGPGYTSYLTHSGIVMALKEGLITLSFGGANPHATIAPSAKLPGVVSYFRGSDPRRWHADIPTYARLTYRGVYPGIDLAFHDGGESIEYDWVLRPGAHLGAIRLRVWGGSTRLSPDGGLILSTRAGRLVQRPPFAYQPATTGRTPVQVRFALARNGGVSLVASGYDRTRPLVVDPVLRYATYFGGTGFDTAKATTVDAAGDVYITGATTSPDFPTRRALQRYHPAAGLQDRSDVYVTELNPSGQSVIFSSYIGGSRFDGGFGIAVDHAGISVAGDTGSPDFPTVHAFQPKPGGTVGSDGFVLKLAPAGDSLLYSSYIGGTLDDHAYSVAVDASGNTYITGDTLSILPSNLHITLFPFTGKVDQSGSVVPFIPPGPTTGPIETQYDHAFVARINPDGTLRYCLLLGGSGEDAGYGIAASPAGAVYVTGLTTSEDFPGAHGVSGGLVGGQDAFVVEIDAAAAGLVYSVHLGGNDVSVGDAIALDPSGNAYVAGQTSATDFPVVGGFQRRFGGKGKLSVVSGDAFVTKLDRAGTIRYSTYLGGRQDEEAQAVAVDAGHNVYVTGWTNSRNFPTESPLQRSLVRSTCFSPVAFPCEDAFVTIIRSDGTLGFSTYYGGKGEDFGEGIAALPNGTVYIAGSTSSSALRTLHPLQSRYRSDSGTTFVLKFDPGSR